MNDVRKTYLALLEAFGPQGWWPVSPDGTAPAEYESGRRPETLGEQQRHEVCWGCVLAQNTAWKNAATAIEALRKKNLMTPAAILACDQAKLAETIRSSGYYNQKAVKLQALAAFLSENRLAGDTMQLRRDLLTIKGVGPETADSILLYAFGRHVFVVDAYTRRLFGRMGLLEESVDYEETRAFVEASGLTTQEYVEFHALIVELAKRFCTKRKPDCLNCPLRAKCKQKF